MEKLFEKLFSDKKKPFDNFWVTWFFYLAFPIMSLISKPSAQMWTGFALLAVFVVLIILGFKDKKRRVAYIIALIILISYFTVNDSPYMVYMFFYTIPMIGMLPSTRQFITVLSVLLISVVTVVTLDFDRFYGEGLWYIFPSLVILFILPFGMRARMKANELKEKLTLANDEIARLATIEERQRISRDLHDTLGHTLSLITLKSELAEKLILKSPERAVQEVKDIQATSRAALKQVRELISGMHAVSIQDEIQQSKGILAAASIEFEVQGALDQFQAPPMVQNIFGMCLREAVTNVVKHSGASKCSLILQEESGNWMMTISDNGVPCEGRPERAQSTGRGLLGMKERLELIDGTMSFHMGKGAGTRLIIKVPRIIRGM
ncbi:sensor histidine kinase [Paenibacillus sp. GCM10027628]|uniref:sensor histidine kinase n=1 Tax=Paenibacillus sp. GCM10027628 TaxID=3273413 RepID=UPI00362EBBC1